MKTVECEWKGFHLCFGLHKVTVHAVGRLNIYWGMSLHCHYHLAHIIKQHDTLMMRQLRMLNKTRCWKEQGFDVFSNHFRGHWSEALNKHVATKLTCMEGNYYYVHELIYKIILYLNGDGIVHHNGKEILKEGSWEEI